MVSVRSCRTIIVGTLIYAVPATVVLNANRHVTGTLRGFDQFMNLVLDNTVDDKTKSDIGMVVSHACSCSSSSDSSWCCTLQIKEQLSTQIGKYHMKGRRGPSGVVPLNYVFERAVGCFVLTYIRCVVDRWSVVTVLSPLKLWSMYSIILMSSMLRHVKASWMFQHIQQDVCLYCRIFHPI